MTTRILLAWQGASEALPRIRSVLGPGCEFLIPRPSPDYGGYEADPDEVICLAPDAQVMIGWHFPRDAIERASRLKFISWLHAGCDLLELKLLRDKGVTVCNVRGMHAVLVAEHAVALMLALAKRLVADDAAVKRTEWIAWSAASSTSLAGKLVTIVGMGHVGREIAKRCKGLDMAVIGLRKHSAHTPTYVNEVHTIDYLQQALGRSDFLILALPLTKETKGLIGYAELQSMKPSAFLINVCRGAVVKEAAIYDALVKGTIAGFASDVWWDYSEAVPHGYHYNVPSRLGVHRLPNVIGTADAAARAPDTRERMVDLGVENIRAFLNGQTLERQVDLDKGY